MKSLIGSSFLVMLFVGSSSIVSQTQESSAQQKTAKPDSKTKGKQKRDVDQWMKAKQKHSHEIFDGLIAGDFTKIEEASVKMMGNNFLESWLADRKEYKQHFAYHGELNAFEYSTKELWRFAKQKDIDGALRSYGVMSRSCVRCHHLIRDGGVSPDKRKDIAWERTDLTTVEIAVADVRNRQ